MSLYPKRLKIFLIGRFKKRVLTHSGRPYKKLFVFFKFIPLGYFVNIHIFSSVLFIEILFLLEAELFVVGGVEVLLDKVLVEGGGFIGNVVDVVGAVVVSYCAGFIKLTLLNVL